MVEVRDRHRSAAAADEVQSSAGGCREEGMRCRRTVLPSPPLPLCLLSSFSFQVHAVCAAKMLPLPGWDPPERAPRGGGLRPPTYPVLKVQYTLDFPWYASLPRIEARTYLDQYGCNNDVWIGKTLYRMPLVNNNAYLELARQDFNRCQVLHQLEWHGLQKWFIEDGLEAFGMAPEDVLRSYFLAAACIF